MIAKSYTKTGKKCRVTFKLDETQLPKAEKVTVLGDFNGWSPEATELKLRKNGSFSVTTSLEAGRDYRFRYLLDGQSWLSDDQADALVPNRFGDRDSVVSVPAPQ